MSEQAVNVHVETWWLTFQTWHLSQGQSVMGGGEGEPAALGSSEYCMFMSLVLVGSIVYILWCSLPGELDSPLCSSCTGVVGFFLVEGDPAPSAMDDAILWFLVLNQQMTMMSTRKMRRTTTPPTDIPMIAVIPRPRGRREWKRIM